MHSEKTETRNITLNLPQMAFHGLSENWFMKEIGDIHWMMLCDSFGCSSDALTDSSGNRLYSSFVRVRFQSSGCLRDFSENEKITMQGRIGRFGNKMFLSDIAVDGTREKTEASLMTVFVARETDNKSLTGSFPAEEENCGAEVFSSMPEFAAEYFRLKRGISQNGSKTPPRLTLGGESFGLGENDLFSTDYEINPYTDLNGLNLLYFASYPQINDICERKYFSRIGEQSDMKVDWAFAVSTVARDVLYFGNCDIGDQITYRLDSSEFVEGYKTKLVSSLIRKKDDFLIAKIFTVRQLTSA